MRERPILFSAPMVRAAPSPQPAPTVDDLRAKLMWDGTEESINQAFIASDARLRALLSTLDDEHRRRGMAAVTNERK